jgi:hypothetical protein
MLKTCVDVTGPRFRTGLLNSLFLSFYLLSIYPHFASASQKKNPAIDEEFHQLRVRRQAIASELTALELQQQIETEGSALSSKIESIQEELAKLGSQMIQMDQDRVAQFQKEPIPPEPKDPHPHPNELQSALTKYNKDIKFLHDLIEGNTTRLKVKYSNIATRYDNRHFFFLKKTRKNSSDLNAFLKKHQEEIFARIDDLEQKQLNYLNIFPQFENSPLNKDQALQTVKMQFKKIEEFHKQIVSIAYDGERSLQNLVDNFQFAKKVKATFSTSTKENLKSRTFPKISLAMNEQN